MKANVYKHYDAKDNFVDHRRLGYSLLKELGWHSFFKVFDFFSFNSLSENQIKKIKYFETDEERDFFLDRLKTGIITGCEEIQNILRRDTLKAANDKIRNVKDKMKDFVSFMSYESIQNFFLFFVYKNLKNKKKSFSEILTLQLPILSCLIPLSVNELFFDDLECLGVILLLKEISSYTTYTFFTILSLISENSYSISALTNTISEKDAIDKIMNFYFGRDKFRSSYFSKKEIISLFNDEYEAMISRNTLFAQDLDDKEFTNIPRLIQIVKKFRSLIQDEAIDKVYSLLELK